MENNNGMALLGLVMQYVELQQRLEPLLPVISQKLIADLMNTGTKPRAIGKSIGRNTGFIMKVHSGQASLTAQQIVKIIRFAAIKQIQNASTE